MNDNNLAINYNNAAAPVERLRIRPTLRIVPPVAAEAEKPVSKSHQQYLAQIAMLAEIQKPFTAPALPPTGRRFHRDHF